MKSITKSLCFCMFLLFPFATHAKFTGEVIFLYHGNDWNELWITHIENAMNARLLYKHNEREGIRSYAIQKDGPLIVISAGSPGDIFLIDRNRLRAGARNLTQKRFNDTSYVDISPNGDILFKIWGIHFEPDVIKGLYLMPSEEIKKVKPQATLLKGGSIDFVHWSPDSEQFLYLTGNGLFLYNLFTGEETLITKDKLGPPLYPVFSPDGKTLVFMHQPTLEPGIEIDVISLETLHPQLFKLDLEKHRFFGLKWPTKKYLVYGIKDMQTRIRRHFVIHIDGGPPQQILEDLEDMFEKGISGYVLANTTFAVEPTNRLTAVWGKLKTGSLK